MFKMSKYIVNPSNVLMYQFMLLVINVKILPTEKEIDSADPRLLVISCSEKAVS